MSVATKFSIICEVRTSFDTFLFCMQNGGGSDAKHKTPTKRKKSETPAKKVSHVQPKFDVNI